MERVRYIDDIANIPIGAIIKFALTPGLKYNNLQDHRESGFDPNNFNRGDMVQGYGSTNKSCYVINGNTNAKSLFLSRRNVHCTEVN